MLGTWSAISLASLPLVLGTFQAQAGANERAARRARRHDWLAAASRDGASIRA